MTFRNFCLFIGLAILCSVSIDLIAQINRQNLNEHYKITHFTTDDGLPANTLINLQQDGFDYLWIGSYDGLIRFDGNKFSVYDRNNHPELASFQINSINLDNRGILWISTGLGLIKYENGKFVNLAGNDYGFYVESLAIDTANQKLWLGTRNSGLYTYDISKNTYTPVHTKFSKDILNSIVIDSVGGLWIGSEKNGLGYYSNGKWTYYGQEQGLQNPEITWLHPNNQNGLYVCTTSGLYLFKNNLFETIPIFKDIRINKVKTDRDGNVWILTANGIHIQKKDGTWHTMTKADGLSNNDVRDIFFDKEDNIWIATYRGGLNQLKKVKFVTFTAKDGLAVEAMSAVQQVDSNKYIAATTDGKLFTIENEKVKPLVLKTQFTQRVYAIMKDHKSNLWFASYDGLLLVTPDGKERLFTEKDGLPTRQLRNIIEDRNHIYWIGSRPSGIIKLEFNSINEKPVFTPYLTDKLLELDAAFIMSMVEDNDGNKVIGTNTGGVIVLAPNGAITQYNVKKGLKSNVIYSARVDTNGVIWAATSNGISRIENGSVVNYTKKEGLPQEAIYDITEDRDGYFWIPTSKGIIRVSKQQLNDFKDGKLKLIHWRLYDKNDDLIKSECTGATKMYKDLYGNLWFLMLESLVTVNPSLVQLNVRIPKVYVESLTIDDQPVNLYEDIEVPAGAQRLTFSFTALSLKYPKAIIYKYKIENFDREWIDPGSDRQAVYTNVPPGSYVFRVLACNNDGICNTTGVSIPFTVEPHLYQTKWFYLLLILTVSLSVFTYIQLRTRDIKLRAKILENQVEERTREIASQRDELVVLNEELRSSQEEVMAQRDALSEKNDEIEKMNSNLEKIVADRTQVLEEQNRKLAEYAFINAHKLRAPLASILGIINLLEIETDPIRRQKLLDLLQQSSVDLDRITRSINKMLEEGFDDLDKK